MITPYFVSYAPLVNYQIENWRVKKQEGLDVTGRMKALAWITLTPGIIIYIFLMDLVFLLISSVLTPIFFLIHFFSCGKFNFTKMLDSTDVIYEPFLLCLIILEEDEWPTQAKSWVFPQSILKSFTSPVLKAL